MKISLQNILFIIVVFLIFSKCAQRNADVIVIMLVLFLFFLTKSDGLYKFLTGKKDSKKI